MGMMPGDYGWGFQKGKCNGVINGGLKWGT